MSTQGSNRYTRKYLRKPKMIEPEIPYHKIADYLNNKLSTSDRLWIENWIHTTPQNTETFNTLKAEWIYIAEDKPVTINKERVWNTINQHLTKSLSTINKVQISRSFVVKVASIAATIALLVGAGVSFLVKSSIDTINREQAMTTIETPLGQKMLMTLPDNTKVWLNSGSILKYSENFNKENRQITLVGEAFFDVTPNPNKEFIVKTASVNVVVKGTSFDISAYIEDQYVDVFLVEGKLNVTDSNNKLLTQLAPNENVKVNKSTMEFVHSKNIKDAFPLWTQEELVFYNVDLLELVKKLERWYGVEINLINPIIGQKYSFSTKTESIRELLNLFNKITPIEYTVEGKEVTIRCK